MKQLEERIKEVLWEVFKSIPKSFKKCQAILYPLSSPPPFFLPLVLNIQSSLSYCWYCFDLFEHQASFLNVTMLLNPDFPEDPFDLKSDKD